MPAAILGPIAGSVVGGLMSDDSQQSQTASKEPWKDAAPWLRENLRTGQGLQSYYQQNPFNPQQQASYQNIFGDLDAFRNQMAPGLMGFANKLMGGSYQRGGSTAGANGGGLLSGGAQPTGGMMQGMNGMQGQAGPFSVSPGQSYGAIDFAAQNPFTNGSMAPPPAMPADPTAKTPQEIERDRMIQHLLDTQGM